MKAEVIVTPGGGSIHTGEAATKRVQLITVRSALRLHKNTGMQVRRGVNIVRIAQEHTGLRTRKHDELLARLDVMIRELETQIEFKEGK